MAVNENKKQETEVQLTELERKIEELRQYVASSVYSHLSEGANTVVLFRLSNQIYGITVEAVQEVIQMVAITPLPDAPPSIVGIINLRGKMMPVMSLKKKLQLEETPITPDMAIIVLKQKEHFVGVTADGIENVTQFDRTVIETPRTVKHIPPIISGAIGGTEQPIFLINIDYLLSSLDLESLSHILEHNQNEPK